MIIDHLASLFRFKQCWKKYLSPSRTKQNRSLSVGRNWKWSGEWMF